MKRRRMAGGRGFQSVQGGGVSARTESMPRITKDALLAKGYLIPLLSSGTVRFRWKFRI